MDNRSHSFEAAARVIKQRAVLGEAALAACGPVLSPEELEVWCAMVGVEIRSDADVRARVAPIIRAAQLARGDDESYVSRDELRALVLCEEAGRAEAVVAEARAALGAVASDGNALVSELARRSGADASTLSRRDVYLATLGLEIASGAVGACGACVLAERLDYDRDGVVTAADALEWLVPPRSATELRENVTRWCADHHESRPRLAFDALDARGRGLLVRADLKTLGWSETEVDVAFAALDADGSGAVSLQEFRAWIIDLEEEEEEEEDDPPPVFPPKETNKCGAFAAAAAQLRCALRERSANSAQLLRFEFERIDTESSGEISRLEFEALVRSIGVDVVGSSVASLDEVVDEQLVDVDGRSLAALGIDVEELVPTRHAKDRVLVVRSVRGDVDAQERDVLVSVGGLRLDDVAAALEDDDEFLERHPLDALTRRVDELLDGRTSSSSTLGLRRQKARKLTRKQLDILLRSIDADNNGIISLEEIEHFVLEAPDPGEAELGLAIEAARAAALALDGPDTALTFAAIARAMHVAETHVVPTTAVLRWLRSVEVAGTKFKVSRRQASVIADRLDANGDGVVSRSEFDAWLFPQRPLEDVLAAINGCCDRQTKGSLRAFHAALFADGGHNKLDLAANFKNLGCKLKPVELDALLKAAVPQQSNRVPPPKRLTLDALAKILGREIGDDDVVAMPPPPPPPTTQLHTPPQRIAAKKKTVPADTRTSQLRKSAAARRRRVEISPSRRQQKARLAHTTPADFARARALERERRTIDEQPDVPPPPPPPPPARRLLLDDDHEDIRRKVARLQALARAVPCRSMHQAMRREADAIIECQATHIQLTALKTQLSTERVAHAKQLLAQEADAAAQLAERDATVAALRTELDALRRHHRAREHQLQAQLNAVRAASSDAILDERRRAASYYRKTPTRAQDPDGDRG
ncbi:hypothetical protein CTAYLR_001512 [Chrysophaeum taylorii]|uniref:EF-hand domain-containing protein n=1 Tax=Chrysophaeum taylorii TaxID=2483200 RepID=A0AAD7UFB6_9STRA|nr:hypothetical protein CTAYLR_001512 [Chrysophaeum taylorii]